MKNIWHLAVVSYKDSIRKRILWVFLIFSFVLIFTSVALKVISLERASVFDRTAGLAAADPKATEVKMTKDMGIASIATFAVLIIIFTAASQIPEEIEGRTLYTLLTFPLKRRHYILGKFLGQVLLILTIVAVMTAILCLSLMLRFEGLDTRALMGLVALSSQLWIVGLFLFLARAGGKPSTLARRYSVAFILMLLFGVFGTGFGLLLAWILSRRGLEDLVALSILGDILVWAEMLAAGIVAVLVRRARLREAVGFRILGGVFVAALLVAASYLAVFLPYRAIDVRMLKGIYTLIVQLSVLASVCVMLSTFAPVNFNIIFCFVLFLAGHTTGYIKTLSEGIKFAPAKWGVLAAYTLIPNFEYFNLSNELTLKSDVSTAYLFSVTLYGLIYITSMLLIGVAAFRDRQI